jgi:hypothetical protein
LSQSNWANEVLRQTRRNKLMTAVLSTLRTVPIYPAGAEKPLSILRPTAEVVEAAREGVAADRDAVRILRDDITAAEEAVELGLASSTGIELAATQSQQRRSIDSQRSFDPRKPALGLRRAKD